MKLTDNQIQIVGLLLNTLRYLWVAPITLLFLPLALLARSSGGGYHWH